ncbi:MAG TPA: hypothetical protein P5266_01005 [Candidatus Fermentibacter sp.]|nr:hypothetical protein [Candidatus Fermentibacter sp.]
MNRIVVLSMIAALAVLSGCDPFGTDETSVYVTGMIWEDSAHTIPAEGITVVAHGDSINTFDRSSETGESGVFWVEVPLYPTPGEEGTGYTMPEFAALGFTAHFGIVTYVYADLDQSPFFIELGDTLEVWDIDLESMGLGGGE